MSGKRRVGVAELSAVSRWDCDHVECVPPNGFDEERAKSMTVVDVRKHFPRFFGRCPDCGDEVPVYASYEHYAAGEW